LVCVVDAVLEAVVGVEERVDVWVEVVAVGAVVLPAAA
jgi:hypothetical protein